MTRITFANSRPKRRYVVPVKYMGEMHGEVYASPEVFAFDAKDARITTLTTVHESDRVTFEWMGVKQRPEPLSDESTEKLPIFSGDFLGGNVNVGHHIFEFMTRLPLFDEIGREKRVFIWSDLPQVCRDLITLAGWAYEPVPRSQFFRSVTVTSCPVGRGPDNTPHVWPDAVWALRRMLCRPLTRQADRRVFIPRVGAAHRNILNQDELANWLSKMHGIEVVDMASMSAADQIALMQESALVVMPMGSGSPFTMFTDGKVLELSPPGINGVFGSRMWAAVCNRPWTRVDGDVEESAAKARDADYVIDLDQVSAALDSMDS